MQAGPFSRGQDLANLDAQDATCAILSNPVGNLGPGYQACQGYPQSVDHFLTTRIASSLDPQTGHSLSSLVVFRISFSFSDTLHNAK